MAACVTCGREFEPRSTLQVYCCAKCRNSSPTRQHKRGIYPMVEQTCERCGRTFETRKRYATKTRSGTATRCPDCHHKKLSLDEISQRLLRGLVARIGVCCECGGVFVTGGVGAFCSVGCRAGYWRNAVRVENGWDTRRECLTCGEEFDAAYTGGRRSCYCSEECRMVKVREARSAAKARRRARSRGAHCESINPVDVFVRDGWICQICGDKTPRRLRGTFNDKAPELDHIIALAAGGTHTWDNVQCLCRACNIAKGAGAMNDQLRLELSV